MSGIIKILSFALLSAVAFSVVASEIDVFYPRFSGTMDGNIGNRKLDDECHKYLVKHSSNMTNNLVELLILYKENDWVKMNEIINKENYSLYMKNLLECGNSYKYEGDIDYFRDAYSVLLLLDHIYETSIKKGLESKINVDDETNILLDYIRHIKGSKLKNKNVKGVENVKRSN